MGDIDKTVRALVAALDGPPCTPERKWPSPVLSLFDCILSLDKRKPGWVDATLQRLQKPDLGYGSLRDTRNYASAFPEIEQYFGLDLLDTGKRAALLLPLLDALIDAQMDFLGETEADRMKAWAEAARPADWTFGPYRGLGLKGFQKFRKLLGANTVVPTKEIVAFVARAAGREVEATEAVYLLERAAGRLKYCLPGILGEVWNTGAEVSSSPGRSGRSGPDDPADAPETAVPEAEKPG